MTNPPENVILFPKWRRTLEEESLLAIKEKRYDDALPKLDQLMAFGVYNQDINIGRLICLMELNRYRQAQEFCEILLANKDEHYYSYVHIYLTILFQTNQYMSLMNQVDRELASGHVPDDMAKQFKQLHALSRRLREDIQTDKTSTYINALFQAVRDENHIRQYTLVEQLRKLALEPTKPIQFLLQDNRVHSVTKTALFVWFQEKEISEKVHIHKLGAEQTIIPEQVPPFNTHPVMQQILAIIDDEGQKNPTLFQFSVQLLRHYLYVRFPFMPAEDDVCGIAATLMAITENDLALHTTRQRTEAKQLTRYIEEIKMCEAIYSAIIDDG